MQNENNVNTASSASVAPTMPAAPTVPAEDKKDKMSKKQIIGLVVMSVIAVGGVLFGIYGMNSQNEQIAELTAKVTDADGRVAELETDKITITEPDGSMTEITDSAETTAVNPEDYIYIGEWGIKIKIGDSFRLVDMSFGVNDSYDADNSLLRVAVSSPDSFASVSNRYAGSDGHMYPYNFIVRTKETSFSPFGWEDAMQPVYNDGEYNYFVYQPTGFMTEGIDDPETLIKTYNDLFTELNNSENYSLI